uniref:Uncharacterized protein n=1 Tax=Anguilla anguilla TaxID=7936 RepID=A0A0E9T0Q4_ANGAN
MRKKSKKPNKKLNEGYLERYAVFLSQ